jgi:hypothetical protein
MAGSCRLALGRKHDAPDFHDFRDAHAEERSQEPGDFAVESHVHKENIRSIRQNYNNLATSDPP